MVSSAKLLHLLEAFSTPWFLFVQPTNHHLAFFLLEVFNNIIQYQFDGKFETRLKYIYPRLVRFILLFCFSIPMWEVAIRELTFITNGVTEVRPHFFSSPSPSPDLMRVGYSFTAG